MSTSQNQEVFTSNSRIILEGLPETARGKGREGKGREGKSFGHQPSMRHLGDARREREASDSAQPGTVPDGWMARGIR